jgi:hypothetical protein
LPRMHDDKNGTCRRHSWRKIIHVNDGSL